MKKEGSASVFFVLLLILLTSVLFAFLEAARVSGLHAQAKLCTAQAVDAVRASYQSEMWNRYHVLFWEEPGGGEQGFSRITVLQQEQVEKNWKLMQRKNNFFFLPIHIKEIEIKKFELATDQNGRSFQKQAAAWIKQSLAEDAVKEVWKVVTQTDAEKMEQDGTHLEEKTEQLLEKLEEKPKDAVENSPTKYTDQSTIQKNDVFLQENPLEWLKEIKEKGVLTVVIPEKELSTSQIDISDSLDKRTRHYGNWEQKEDSGELERILFQLYCKGHLTDATQKRIEGNKLNYEMEYLIGGKSSDIDNLKFSVNRLLLLREGVNLLYLETHPEKNQQAMSAALALTSAVANPELAEPVKQAILAAWAYAESVCDVRILLNGGKVSLVKSDEEWRTDLQNLGSSLQNTSGGQNQNQSGLSYAGYLQILMRTIPEKKLVFRCMDLIEHNLDVQMDEMISRTESVYTYGADALFWKFVRVENGKLNGIELRKQAVMEFVD